MCAVRYIVKASQNPVAQDNFGEFHAPAISATFYKEAKASI